MFTILILANRPTCPGFPSHRQYVEEPRWAATITRQTLQFVYTSILENSTFVNEWQLRNSDLTLPLLRAEASEIYRPMDNYPKDPIPRAEFTHAVRPQRKVHFTQVTTDRSEAAPPPTFSLNGEKVFLFFALLSRCRIMVHSADHIMIFDGTMPNRVDIHSSDHSQKLITLDPLTYHVIFTNTPGHFDVMIPKHLLHPNDVEFFKNWPLQQQQTKPTTSKKNTKKRACSTPPRSS